MSKITLLTFKDRVFKNVIKEAFSDLYLDVIGETVEKGEETFLSEAIEVLSEELGFETKTKYDIAEDILKHRSYYSKMLVETAERITEYKTDELESKTNIEEEQTELNDNDQEIVQNLFSKSIDEDHLAEVRDTVAKAVEDEKEKADAVKEAIQHDKENNENGELTETTMNMIKRNPNTLLESILKGLLNRVINEAVNAGANPNDSARIIKEQSEFVKDMGTKIYTIYETINKFGFKAYTEKDVDDLIYKYNSNLM